MYKEEDYAVFYRGLQLTKVSHSRLCSNLKQILKKGAF